MGGTDAGSIEIFNCATGDHVLEATVNVSSVVIRSLPEHLPEVERALLAAGLGEVHFKDDQGRMVVTIEGADADEEISKLRAIQNLPFVLVANLSYTYSDDGFAPPAGGSDPPPEDRSPDLS